MLQNRARIILVSVLCLCVVFVSTVGIGLGLGFGLGLSRPVFAARASAVSKPKLSTGNRALFTHTSSQSGCTTPAPTLPQTLVDWPEYGFDGTGRRDNTAETILSASSIMNAGGLCLVSGWPVAANPNQGPVLIGGNLIFQENEQDIAAINGSTGVRPWPSSVVTGTNANGIAGGAGVVYVGENDSRGYAINASTGALIGVHLYDANFYSFIAVQNGVVYASLDDHYFYAINGSTGVVLWRTLIGDPVITNITVVNGVVYFGGSDNWLYALNASTGSVEWSFPVQNGIAGGVTILPASNGNPTMLYACTPTPPNNAYTPTTLNAYNATTGSSKPVWTTSVTTCGFAMDNTNIYIPGTDPATGNPALFAINAMSGAPTYYSPIDVPDDGSLTQPAVANGVVYAGSSNSTMYGWATSNGAKVWQYPLGTGIYSAPIVANGMVYVQAGIGFYAFALPS